MVSFIVRLRFAPEDRADMAETVRLLADASRQEQGCISYIPLTLEEDPDTLLIFEQYVDPSALDAHRASAHFERHAIGGLYQRMKDRSVENLRSIE